MASLFEQIESLIGPDATAKLLGKLGGRRVRIWVEPAQDAGDSVTDAVGIETSRMLSRAFAGERVHLPVAEALEWRRRAAERRGQIMRMYEERHMRPGEIASALRCSERFVYLVVNGK